MTSPEAQARRERAREMRRQGAKLSTIAEALGVSVPRIHVIVRDMPEHAEVRAAQYAARRLYPADTQRLRARLTAAGWPPAERLAECRRAAGEAARHG